MIYNFRLAGVGVAGVLFLFWIWSTLITLGETTNVPGIAFGLLSLGLIALWVSYLWSHRDDFS
jgi:hypothetical protein